jgi:hypothetical protein
MNFYSFGQRNNITSRIETFKRVPTAPTELSSHSDTESVQLRIADFPTLSGEMSSSSHSQNVPLSKHYGGRRRSFGQDEFPALKQQPVCCLFIDVFIIIIILEKRKT